MRLPLFKIEDPEHLRRVKQWPARRRLLIVGRLPPGNVEYFGDRQTEPKSVKGQTNINKHHKLAN